MKYLDFFNKLNQKNIEYLIVGGLAAVIYGSPRFTYDIDIVLKLDDENIYNFVGIMIDNGYKIKIPVNPYDFAIPEKREDWIKNKNMKALNFYNDCSNLPEVDIVIDNADYTEFQKTKKVFIIEGIEIPIVSIDDLIKMKENAGRNVDFEDIKFLNFVKRNLQ